MRVLRVLEVTMRDGNTKRSVKTVSLCAPGMSDNLAVKVRYGLGSGNH